MSDRPDFDHTDRPHTAQPPPVHQPGWPSVHHAAAQLLVAYGYSDLATDLLARGDFGTRKYGTPLQAGNGRDALTDAYEEGLDQIAYLTQDDLERTAAGLAPRSGDLLPRAVALTEDIRAGRLEAADA